MFIFCTGKIKIGNLICDKVNKCAGQINWGKNTHRGKDGKLVKTTNIKPVPDFSPRNNIWQAKNSWFKEDVIPEFQLVIKNILKYYIHPIGILGIVFMSNRNTKSNRSF